MVHIKIDSVKNEQLKSELLKVDNGDKKIYLFELKNVDVNSLSEEGLSEYNLLNTTLKYAEIGEAPFKSFPLLSCLDGIKETWKAIFRQYKDKQ